MLNFCDFIQVYVYTTNYHLKQRLAWLLPGWVTHGSCSGADIGLARFITLVAACLTSSWETTLPCL